MENKNEIREFGFEMSTGAEREALSAWQNLEDALSVGRACAKDLHAFFEARTKLGVSEIPVDENLGFAVLAQIRRGFTRGVIFETYNQVTGRKRARYALLTRFFDRFFLLPLYDFVEVEALYGLSGEEVIQAFFDRPKRWMIDEKGEVVFLPLPEEFAPSAEVAGNFVKVGAVDDLTLFDFEKGEIIQPPAGSVFFAFRLSQEADSSVVKGREILAEKKRIFHRTSDRLKVFAAVKFLHENSTWITLNSNFQTSLHRKERLLLAVSASAKTRCGMYQADWGRRIEIQTPLPKQIFTAIPNSVFVRKVYDELDKELSKQATGIGDVVSFVFRAVDAILWKVQGEVEGIKKRGSSSKKQASLEAVLA